MKTNKKFSFTKLFYNNKFLVFFSLITAFVIWSVISLNQNPIRQKVFSDVTVNITTENTVASELGLDIISGGVGEKVNVTVSGPNYIVSSMNVNDILVSASLSDVTAAGEYELTLTATQNSSKTGYSFVSIVPDKILVDFDYIDTKEFTVVADAVGAAAVKGLVVDTPVVSDSENTTISIKGARTEMNKIASVVASAQVNKTLSATESFDATIQLLDEKGKELDQKPFTLSTNEIKISVPISKKAVLPLTASFDNAPDEFSKAVSYKLSTKTVTVLGPEATINKLKSIPLASVDISKLSKTNNRFDVALILPDGVKLVDNIQTVTITFDTSDLQEKAFTVKTVKYINVTAGLSPKASAAIKNVSVIGPKSVVKKLEAGDLYALVDLSGKTAGQYTVTAKIQCKESGKVWQVGEYNVIVTLK